MTIISTEVITSNNSLESMVAIMHGNIPVITTELLADVYETNVNNIKVNHSRNAERFIEGKHYFKLTGLILKEFKHKVTQSNFVKIAKNVRHLILWTERGAARHAKMLDTDKAWDVFEKLEDFYFNQKEQATVADKTTVQQRNPLKNAVNLLVSKKGIMYPEAYSLIHQRFNVEHIDELAADLLPQAVEYVHKLALEGELLPREELPAPRVQQISDDDLQTLCWLWEHAIKSAEYMSQIAKLLWEAEHRLAGEYAEYPRDVIRVANDAKRVLEKATNHIQIKKIQLDGWRILHNLRRPDYPF
jgi:hypothetical protein